MGKVYPPPLGGGGGAHTYMAYMREHPSPPTEVLFPLASEHTYRSLGWILLQDTRVAVQLPKGIIVNPLLSHRGLIYFNHV